MLKRLPKGATELGVYRLERYYYDKANNVYYKYMVTTGTFGGTTTGYIEVTRKGELDNVKVKFKDKLVSLGGTSDDDYLVSAESGVLGSIKPTAGKSDLKSSVCRYPSDITVGKESDYVIFQFAKYKPPFKSASEDDRAAVGALADYNSSISDLEVAKVPVKIGGVATEVDQIILPMPQDLSTEQKQNWVGKKFTRIGAAAIAGLNGDFSNLKNALKDTRGNLGAMSDALKTSMINKIPGVGGNLSINDLSGSTRGVVLNPNAELLYDSPDLREIGMVFKLVPQNKDEAKDIKRIVDAFRTASLPTFGSNESIKGQSNEQISGSNWITVPLLCKFTFMTGSDPNSWIAQYKPCGIVQVQVNYTPDGTYATLNDGSPVATELSIRFVETKLVFNREIQEGF
tara:strand:- start:655 stop:1854 length:1200 start_codon:yes stop_codon:yes gene_type:complete